MRRMLDTMRRCGYLSGLHDQYRDYYLKAESFDEDNAIRNFDGSFYRNDEWPGGEERALCTMLGAGLYPPQLCAAFGGRDRAGRARISTASPASSWRSATTRCTA